MQYAIEECGNEAVSGQKRFNPIRVYGASHRKVPPNAPTLIILSNFAGRQTAADSQVNTAGHPAARANALLNKTKMLEIKNASLTAGGRRLFSGLSFTVADGQTVCLTGCSGSGKTTLLRAILGFHPLDEGHISIDGELLTPSSAEEFRKHISYIPQELMLPSEWVSDMVRLPFGLKVNRNIPFSKDLLMAEWRRLELQPELYEKKVAELSGGERQRAMLSVSGLLGKAILLLDEPTSALDAHSASLVAAYLRLLASRGCSVVAVSHDQAFAEACDKTVNIG